MPATTSPRPNAAAPITPRSSRIGSVLPEREAAEVDRRVRVFDAELNPSGQLGQFLVRHIATMSVRMERCAIHENAAATARVRKALAEFVPPEGADAAEIKKLRDEAEAIALFDPSAEAKLARRHEAAAERSFFRALKELRAVERQVSAAEDDEIDARLASFKPGDMTDDEFDKLYAETMAVMPEPSHKRAESADNNKLREEVERQYGIGKRR